MAGLDARARGMVVVAALVISLVALLIVVLMAAGVNPKDLFGKESSCSGRTIPGVYNPGCGPRDAWERAEQVNSEDAIKAYKPIVT